MYVLHPHEPNKNYREQKSIWKRISCAKHCLLLITYQQFAAFGKWCCMLNKTARKLNSTLKSWEVKADMCRQQDLNHYFWQTVWHVWWKTKQCVVSSFSWEGRCDQGLKIILRLFWMTFSENWQAQNYVFMQYKKMTHFIRQQRSYLSYLSQVVYWWWSTPLNGTRDGPLQTGTFMRSRIVLGNDFK